MSPKIHPTSIVDKKAELAADVEIGPFSVIGAHVKIGAGTVIHNHVTVEGRTTIGERNDIWHSCAIGAPAQTYHYKNLKNAGLVIGNDNIIREYVTINTADKDGAETVIGDRNFIMIGTHVAHDCHLGNDNTLANYTALGGHAVVEDKVVTGGLAGVHQFVRLGRLSMVGGMSKVIMDVPPFSICDGNPMKICGVNSVGLRRAGYSSQDALKIRRAIRLLFRAGGSLAEAIEKVNEEFKDDPDVQHLLAFVKSSKRGLPRRLMIIPEIE